MSNYFDKLGIVQYGNTFCRNIVSRASIAKEVLQYSSVFYPYELKQGERADTLSSLYYDDPSLDWLIYYANDIVDPYFDFYLSDEQLIEHIKTKYGSVAKAQQKIKHYEVNWIGDDTKIAVSAYNLLTSNSTVDLKKYWRPEVNDRDVAVSYVRKELDLIVSTNQVLSFEVTNGASFDVGERAYQLSGPSLSAVGEVTFANSTNVIVKNTSGSFLTTRTLKGEDSNSNTAVVSSKTLYQNIPSQELIYWNPVSFYDYEIIENEKKKSLRLVDRSYKEIAERNLSDLMK